MALENLEEPLKVDDDIPSEHMYFFKKYLDFGNRSCQFSCCGQYERGFTVLFGSNNVHGNYQEF